MNNVLKGGSGDLAAQHQGTPPTMLATLPALRPAGRNLPATASALYVSSKPIKASDGQPGDLALLNMNSKNPGDQHVAMYAGDGKMLHNNDGSVREEPVWGGAQFRRLSGVKPSDLAAVPGATGTPSGPLVGNTPRGGGSSAPTSAASRILKYVDNNDGTWTAHHADGTTEVVRTRSQLAPVEGGRHPSTVGARAACASLARAGQAADRRRGRSDERPWDAQAGCVIRAGRRAIETVSNVPTKVWGTPPPPGPVWAAAYTPTHADSAAASAKRLPLIRPHRRTVH
jgi:hypothetical protein